VNEPVGRENAGHIRHNDRLATQAPAEPEILAFRPEGYDVYTGCQVGQLWCSFLLGSSFPILMVATSTDALILNKSKLGG
jgi:hypothetical protein